MELASPAGCSAGIGWLLRYRALSELAALLSYWSDALLGRFTEATRLCPGKMALDEQQCSAPPRWRSISLTHVEFPEGM